VVVLLLQDGWHQDSSRAHLAANLDLLLSAAFSSRFDQAGIACSPGS
jgi:hypothetical protein